MTRKNDKENYNLENNSQIEIEYNEDFTSEKTKSLNKFSSKLEKNSEFYLDNSYKNFSRSLGFNFKQCFAPKSKTRKSSKNPTPLIFKKNENICNLNTQDRIITEDALSEKGSSLNNDSSFSSDSENFYEEIKNINVNKEVLNNNNNIKNEKNEILNNKINPENKNNLNEISKDKNNDNNIKVYEHRTIGIFHSNNNDKNSKGNIKSIRNDLFKIKLKNIKIKNKEMEYIIKEKEKIRYRLDIIKKPRKDELDNDYKIITINNMEDNNNSEDDNCEDMSNLRTTISYSNSKINKDNNKKNEDKGITIYDVLKKNKKNKKI